MNFEVNRGEETSVHSMVESVSKQFNNEKINASKSSGKNEGITQNESKTHHQNSSNSSNTPSNNQPFSTVKSASRENLDQNHPPPHLQTNLYQSHNNLSASTNDPHLSAVKNNPNINALDLPPSRDTYKTRRKVYQQEKKKLAEQLLSTLNDPTLIVLADWLKVRALGFKTWTKVWCELRPGLLVIYKSAKVHKSGQWIGTVLLNITSVIERPSKKDGFCFKLFNVTDQNIWARSGPKGETFGAITLPLPPSYLMFRAASQQAGSRWIKAIALSFQCSKQMIRNDLHRKDGDLKLNTEVLNQFSRLLDDEIDINDELKDEHEIEREHFIDQDLTDDQNSSAEHEDRSTDSDTTGSLENDFSNLANKHANKHQSEEKLDRLDKPSQHPKAAAKPQPRNKTGHNEASLPGQSSQPDKRSRQLITIKRSPSETSMCAQLEQATEYVYQPEESGRFGVDEHSQVDLGGDENKSLLWSLLKQVRPGDLSKVVLPTFILEPRSFLEKLCDYYYHCDILASSTTKNDPFERMKEVVRWYVSGLYKKPNGLKKPYNPILGEAFRCYWEHPPKNGDESDESEQKSDQMTKTFYVAEQISHHPPVSAFHCVNRHQGYLVSGVVQVSSNYYGNSVSAILHGNVRLSLINRGEDYLMTMPYAHCKGILFGGLTFELGGKVAIKCERTNYSCELDFKLKPFLGGEMNLVYGKIRLGNETLATIEGHWDREIKIKEKRTGKQSVLWEASQSTFSQRLKRYVVPMSQQNENESQKLWAKVSEAILAGDQKVATVEKTKLEERQRRETKYRLENSIEYQPKLFVLDPLTNEWHYRFEDNRPWDNRTDIVQFEKSFVIQTLTKHRTISKTSLTSLNLSRGNCSVELSPVLGLAKPSVYSNLTSLTSQKCNLRKRSPKSRSKAKSSSPITMKKLNDSSVDRAKKSDLNESLFSSVDGDEEEDTDCSSTFKNLLKHKSSSVLTSQLIKRIEQNECEFKRSLVKLKDRQQKLEQVILDERKKSSKSSGLFRDFNSGASSRLFSVANLITVFVLTVIIQLIIYKFSNNYLRK